MRVEAGGGEPLGELGQHVGPDHLAADAGHPPARQVETLGHAGLGAARAQLEGEGRPERDRAAKIGQELQPQQRPAGERRARQVVDGDLRHHGRQAAADQAHVVVERQPGCAAVVAAQRQPVGRDRAGVGRDGALRDQDAAREARAAGGVLDVAGLVGAERHHRPRGDRPSRDLRCGGDAGDLGRRGGLAERGHQVGRRHGDPRARRDEHPAQPLDIGVVAADVDAQAARAPPPGRHTGRRRTR